MNDLIYRQTVLDALGEEPFVWDEDDAGEIAERNRWRRNVAVIKALPSAQSERKTGYWIEADDMIISGYCSVCGWQSILYETDVVGMPYCPNCGARMEIKHDS